MLVVIDVVVVVICTTIKTTKVSVTTEVGVLFAAGWAWLTGDGVNWAWLVRRGRCTESRPELETVNK